VSKVPLGSKAPLMTRVPFESNVSLAGKVLLLKGARSVELTAAVPLGKTSRTVTTGVPDQGALTNRPNLDLAFNEISGKASLFV